jgi:hypothetical protein
LNESGAETANSGWGIEVDKKLAAKYPHDAGDEVYVGPWNGGLGMIRHLDSTVVTQ